MGNDRQVVVHMSHTNIIFPIPKRKFSIIWVVIKGRLLFLIVIVFEKTFIYPQQVSIYNDMEIPILLENN